MGYSDYIKTYYKDGKKYVDIDTEGLLKEIDNDPSVRIGIRLPDEYRIDDSKFIFGEYLTSPGLNYLIYIDSNIFLTNCIPL